MRFPVRFFNSRRPLRTFHKEDRVVLSFAFLYSQRDMLILAFRVSLLGLITRAVASPVSSNALLLRYGFAPAIKARVTDQDGLDITSSFQVMLYNESEDLNISTNFTDRRRQSAKLSRPMIDCPVPGAIFIDSVCTYGDKQALG